MRVLKTEFNDNKNSEIIIAIITAITIMKR